MSDIVRDSTGEFIVYTTVDGRTRVELHPVEGTVWLTQQQMAELYDTSQPNIAQIIRRVLSDGEVTEATYNSELLVRQEGDRTVKRNVRHYNLDMVLAVGYRISTTRAIQFRQWATTVLKEYLIKGFVLDDDRLKDPTGSDYFDELLRRIRDIRASERQFYQKIKDLFRDTSVDYDANALVAQKFFQTIQNKLLYAVTGKTAAELIVARADPQAVDMGLTSYPHGKVRKADVATAKNYLTEPEIDKLNRLTTMFLDFADFRAQEREQITMQEWSEQTDRFLVFNERPVLRNAGSVRASTAKQIVGDRYTIYDANRKKTEREMSEIEAATDSIAELEQYDRKKSRRS